MACKHTGARGIILGLVYVLAMIFVAPLRLTDAYEAVALLLPGMEGTLPLLGAGMAGGGISFHVFGGAASGALSGFAAAALLLLAAYGAARLCGARKEGTGQ